MLFKNDNHLYRYDHLGDRRGYSLTIPVSKESATMKIDTFHSIALSDHDVNSLDYIYIDYYPAEGWEFKLYGRFGSNGNSLWDVEVWDGNPDWLSGDFKQSNTIIFGDSLFNEDQLKFQNISKNKEMFDILDVNEVDECYYGLFRDNKVEHQEGVEETYTVFRTAKDDGVVERLPHKIVKPIMYRTADSIYSLYVMVRDEDTKKLKLQEISVPNSDIYVHKTIDL